VFCASMADVFEDHPALPPLRDRLWRLIADTPWLDWLLLTKRPENVAGMVPAGYMNGGWPENCGLGATVENPRYARERIPALVACPARFRFLSCEPLLGALDVDLTGISWLICGGESGAKARPMHPDWARGLRDQCRAAGVPFHFKQWGEYLPVAVEDDAEYAGGRAFDDPRGGGRTAALPGDRRYYRWLGPGLVAVRVGARAAGRELDGEICHDTPALTTRAATSATRLREERKL
jgi:protein gp37